MAGPAQLATLLRQERVSTEELVPVMQEVAEHDPKFPKPELPRVTGLFNPLNSIGTFQDPAWLVCKRVWGVKWDRAGSFIGQPAVTANGGRDYTFRNTAAPKFQFVRWTGEVVTPGSMITDGGSIPRVAWVIPGLDPWTMMPAYIIHDWDFMAHHCVEGYARAFEDVNDTLAEACYTLMITGQVDQDWRVLAAVHAGVSSFVGRQVWNRIWTTYQCQVALNV